MSEKFKITVVSKNKPKMIPYTFRYVIAFSKGRLLFVPGSGAGCSCRYGWSSSSAMEILSLGLRTKHLWNGQQTHRQTVSTNYETVGVITQLISTTKHSAHLQHIKQVLLWNIGEVDLVGRVYDGVDFADLIGDILEWSLPISHAVQDAPQRPHVTFSTDLKTAENDGIILCNLPSYKLPARNILTWEPFFSGTKKWSFLTFDPGFPLEDVSLMASGGM